jgi:hypothetical protein
MNQSRRDWNSGPKMVIIGMDRCLLDCGGESFHRLQPPFSLEAGEFYDANDNLIACGEKVKLALEDIQTTGALLGLMCETPRPDLAHQIFRHLGLESYFDFCAMSRDLRRDQVIRLRKLACLQVDDLLLLDHISVGVAWCEAHGIVGYAMDRPLNQNNWLQALAVYQDNVP